MTPRGSKPLGGGSIYELSEADAQAQEAHFGVARGQIHHDFVISHVLNVLASVTVADQFTFYGGTALSRTFLDGLRLSEDIDLLSVGSRRDVAAAIDRLMRTKMERGFGKIEATPWLSDRVRDTDASIFHIGGVDLKIQLIDGRNYTPWPRQVNQVNQRYAGLEPVFLNTYTASGFVGAKTVAWSDISRNAPRDLYDLWALKKAITPEAAQLYRKVGPTGKFPSRATLPVRAPSQMEWDDSLGHQCVPRVGPEEAFESVVEAWLLAAKNLERSR